MRQKLTAPETLKIPLSLFCVGHLLLGMRTALKYGL